MDQVTEVRQKTDIVQLIQEYLPLKKAGHNFKANCPFHEEKSPSFIVSPQRQIWHCFGGCGKGGDVFSFLMEYEHIEFPEALRILADKAGVKLIQKNFDSSSSSKKEMLYGINRLAAEFYHYLLTKHTLGKNALQYATEKRHIKPQTLRTFLIGYAPTGSALTTYLIKKKGYTSQDLLDAGLAYKRGNLLFDFFQDRLLFALYDHRGNIVGFSGRILQNTDKTSKYINTRETLIYHKGMTFFGFNTAKETIKKENLAILMEGELDVISSFQEGITNVVAVKGTALTEDQVILLSRFCSKVALCFDMDAPGQEALKRSLAHLEKKNMATLVIVLTGGKDADEVIQQDAIIFKKAIKHPVHVYDYLLDQIANKYSISTAVGKQQIGDELLPLFGQINNEIIKEHYIQKLSSVLHVSHDALERELAKRQKETVAKQQLKLLTKPASKSREEMLETYFLALLVQFPQPKILIEKTLPLLSSYQWHNVSLGKVFHFLSLYSSAHTAFNHEDFTSSLAQELLPAFDISYLLPIPILNDDTLQKETLRVAIELQHQFLKGKVKQLSELIQQKEQEGNMEEIEKMQKEFNELIEQMHRKDDK
ncbi:MAG TPA: DNA primase [Patescibacteria group bacterium]|nr:DNA primase [Patescibacteria group bacterium]